MSLDPVTLSRRNAALRLAFGVTVGLLIETTRGAALPTLAPIIAIQLLAAIPRPPGPKLVLILGAVAAAASGLAYFVAIMTVSDPMLYVIGVGLLYLWGFAFAFHPKLAPIGAMVITMTVVITGIAASSTGAALGIMISLVVSVVIGILIVLLAHAALPSPVVEPRPQAAENAQQFETLPIGLRALVATAVILPAHIYLFSQGAGSILILMTTATMLRQPGLDASARYSVSFAIGNLVGAAVAAFGMLIVTLHNDGGVMVAVTAASSLVLAWFAAHGPLWRAVMVPGMVAFVVLYGMIFSPYVDTKEVSVTARAIMVVLGAIYALGAVSVLAPLVGRILRWSAARRAAGQAA
ncbi:MAG: DUF2955 domain-containing protein [Pseudomonadota bacterium]